MRFRKPTVEPLDINLTPMIDCLLFLIVFLLMATTFNHFSRINIVLPEAQGVAVTHEGKSLLTCFKKKQATTENNSLSSPPMPKHHTKR